MAQYTTKYTKGDMTGKRRPSVKAAGEVREVELREPSSAVTGGIVGAARLVEGRTGGAPTRPSAARTSPAKPTATGNPYAPSDGVRRAMATVAKAQAAQVRRVPSIEDSFKAIYAGQPDADKLAAAAAQGRDPGKLGTIHHPPPTEAPRPVLRPWETTKQGGAK